jgi:hypothetical protein
MVKVKAFSIKIPNVLLDNVSPTLDGPKLSLKLCNK